ncbi:hypothetical protein [Streptomyces prasinus]|uniref:hypothetical protein n=1 Tax=Streptomyces prasinus TaxID=67345 RepID=UPI0033F50D3D
MVRTKTRRPVMSRLATAIATATAATVLMAGAAQAAPVEPAQTAAARTVDAAQAVLDSLKSQGEVTDQLVLGALTPAEGARYQRLVSSGRFDALFRASEQTDEFSAQDVRLSIALAALTSNDVGIDEILNITPDDLVDGAEWEADIVEPAQDGLIRPQWKFDWGIVTGTLYLNRKETRNARDAGYVVGLAASVCSAGFPICYPVAAQAGGIGIAAGRYYEEGNCVKLKVIGPTLKPERHKKGKLNCK